MPVRHVPNANLDRRAYDACVEAAPNGVIYGLSWWLDVVSPGWEALVLDDYRAVLPLPVKRRYGIRFVEQPLFCQFLGIFSAEALTENETAAFFDALRKAIRLVARLSLMLPPETAAWASRCYSGLAASRHTFLLDLRLSYETTRAGYAPDRLLNLKRAGQAGWEMHESHDIRPLGEWFRRFHAQNVAGGVAAGSYSLLENLFAEAEKRGVSTLWYAVKASQPEAGAWFVTWRGRAVYLFNAATPTGRHGNARTWLLDRFFQRHAGHVLVFDFESPDVPDIARFYESFGAKPQSYSELRYNRLPGWVRAVWRLKRIFNTKNPHPVGGVRSRRREE